MNCDGETTFSSAFICILWLFCPKSIGNPWQWIACRCVYVDGERWFEGLVFVLILRNARKRYDEIGRNIRRPFPRGLGTYQDVVMPPLGVKVFSRHRRSLREVLVRKFSAHVTPVNLDAQTY
ncbi:hypothetical protein D3C76_1494690 [compost metagenome]